MVKQINNILLIEDNEKHLADAQVEAARRVASGEVGRVDVARDLYQYYILTKDQSHEGVVSDIFSQQM